MIKDAELFRDLDVSKTDKVECANGTESNVEGRGSISFFAKDNQGQDQILELEESMYVPQYTKILGSIKILNEQNASVHFDTKPRTVLDDRSFPLKCENNLFYLQFDCLLEQSNAASASVQLWPERVGHNNKTDVRTLAKAVVDMKLVEEGNEPCVVCNTEKAKRLLISREVATRAKKLFDIDSVRRYISSKHDVDRCVHVLSRIR